MPKPSVVSIDSGTHRARVRARRDELVTAHLSLVEGIARSVARSLPPCFDLDDLIATGNLALLHAATKYRPDPNWVQRRPGGGAFEAYARLVVRGAIVESVRRKRYTEATRPGLEEVPAAAAAVSGVAEADEALDAARRVWELRAAIRTLPAAEQALVREYYAADEPSLKEVASRLSLSVVRGREVHAAALDSLRAGLKRAA